VTLKVIEDLIELSLVVAALYVGLGAYARYRQLAWPQAKRRLAILAMLVLAVTGIKTTEDALSGESGPIDEAILLFIHDRVPAGLTPFFEAITLTASWRALIPLTLAAVIVLLLARRRLEALVVAASTAGGAAIVYLIKTAVGRARPSLWDTAWYWGSSFPSGHTLVFAAFATAVALSIARIQPRWRHFAAASALVWVAFVAVSRLVLGVHWPTDVLVAACVGGFLPLLITFAIGSWARPA
jgi:membrane-associated phospholipid phosphatase